VKSISETILVTGSSGLIGSETCAYFGQLGFCVHGLDNNQRAVFFGPQGDTRWNQRRLSETLPRFRHHELDVRDRAGVLELIKTIRPDVIVNCAAQPSHDLASQIPFDDFDTNAGSVLNLLEAARQYCADSPFIHMSTNKVYGDRPNAIALKELQSRWEYEDPNYRNGISESFSIDQSTHSIFGASKVAADILVQEYGRYFGIPTCCLRAGCLTGPNHSGVELHGFLSYLAKCHLEQREYKIFGYKGKQVRDNIHSEDVSAFIYDFYKAPRIGEVYNIGGGKDNSCSILEVFEMLESITGVRTRYSYVDQNRTGDHICYYSDLRKIKHHYPRWTIQKGLDRILVEIVMSWRTRLRRQ
jgi:CDP-paratose 2-epimerase